MKILVAGDFCPQNRVSEILKSDNVSFVLSEVRPIVESADYAIVNFECPVVKGDEKAIKKNGPNLFCGEKGIEAVKWCGFDCVTLANNHILDFGSVGLENTVASCNKYGLDVVGGGKDSDEASRILYKKIDGKMLAIINCCEHEFSIATEQTAGANPLNPIQQFYAIKEAKKKANFVLVIVHGGHEHYQLPSTRMVEIYRFFIDAGADAVVNHHQHCFSGYEVYNGNPIFYGLGNFCFDGNRSRKEIWHEGYMAEIDFEDNISFRIIPYLQCKEDAKVKLLNDDAYNKKIDELNHIIADPNKLREEQECYYSACASGYGNIFEPLRNRYYLALKRRGLLPSLVSEKRKVQAANFIGCEAHRDKLLHYLNNDIK